MKKMSRKIAAIIAAAMTATTMGAMNAFAADLSLSNGDGGTKTGSANLQIQPYNGTHNDAVRENDDEHNNVWDIDITFTDELVWKVNRNTDGGSYDLNWDVSQHKYVVDEVIRPSVRFTLKDGDAREKSVKLSNNSNFPISYNSSISYAAALSPYNPNFFSITTGSSGDLAVYDYLNTTANESTVTVDLNVNNLSQDIWDAMESQAVADANSATDPAPIEFTNITYGSLNFTFEADGEIVANELQYRA